ncbi:hypothetical protein EVAR_94757_1 [Eumeta japonica]|uniref:Uncharacterized protein n=1 Tax=Eumeta variegata TaxID=151549 RepID=A0A4C1UX46_EUMVA|nr:hypothetical protein EVAR_94757_1 [Eumeta japonica]
MVCQSSSSYHMKIPKIGLISGQPQKIRSSSDLEFETCLKDGKRVSFVVLYTQTFLAAPPPNVSAQLCEKSCANFQTESTSHDRASGADLGTGGFPPLKAVM